MQTLNIESSSTVPFIPNYGEPLDTRSIQKKWTSDEYYRLADLGFFQGKRVQLIEGEIIEMAPMGSRHATGVGLLAELLRQTFGDGFHIRTQAPLDVSDISQPEPDVALFRGTIRDFSLAHPKTAVIVAEVSDSSLSLDRNIKTGLYAQRQIEEYWILNLKQRCLEVYRKPTEDANLGFIYSEQIIVGEEQSITPLAKPKSKIKVADMLP